MIVRQFYQFSRKLFLFHTEFQIGRDGSGSGVKGDHKLIGSPFDFKTDFRIIGHNDWSYV